MWPLFANTLQQHFLMATRQDMKCPKRALSMHDLNYFHHRFFMYHNTISQSEYELFWNWFGSCMRVLRFQRHVKAMWQSGIIYGYMSRETAEIVLRGQPVGTFIIRFAESPPGKFDIVFVGYEKIKHYLVKDEDIRGARKTFPDFLLESPPLLHLLRLSAHPSTDQPVFTPVPKGVILHPYLSPQKPELLQDGYQPLSL